MAKWDQEKGRYEPDSLDYLSQQIEEEAEGPIRNEEWKNSTGAVRIRLFKQESSDTNGTSSRLLTCIPCGVATQCSEGRPSLRCPSCHSEMSIDSSPQGDTESSDSHSGSDATADGSDKETEGNVATDKTRLLFRVEILTYHYDKSQQQRVGVWTEKVLSAKDRDEAAERAWDFKGCKGLKVHGPVTIAELRAKVEPKDKLN